MTLLSTQSGPVAQAAAAAATAVLRSGVEVIEIAAPSEANRAAELLREVWRGSAMPLPGNVIRTIQHVGGYVFGAYDDAGTLLAVSVGMLAHDGLHSHITGVAPFGQRRGLGYALKQHQRSWALAQGMSTVTWTCDPLVRRNVGFNLHALGASVASYLPDHYGAMEDGVNAGDETDRFSFRWDLLSERAVAASTGRLPYLDATDVPSALVASESGAPTVLATAGLTRRVQLPADIEALRRGDAAVGRAWRHAVRDTVLPALTAGATVTGLTTAGELVLEGTP